MDDVRGDFLGPPLFSLQIAPVDKAPVLYFMKTALSTPVITPVDEAIVLHSTTILHSDLSLLLLIRPQSYYVLQTSLSSHVIAPADKVPVL